uniref:CHY zinc finger domain-containing protein n=1 Tax=Trepomonas sp. PC1 TaxID=1076344 RepID=A0A146KCY0_9EUKA|eukprot:JAP94680.1 CHY zinc finger domain-containing protein [Trepomonas sp. PC1]
MLFVRYHTGEAIGCEHYISNVALFCEECQQWFNCKRCHDEIVESHKMKPYGQIQCYQCGLIQNPQELCQQCDLQLYNYACERCNIFCFLSNSLSPCYHCEKCNQCEVGIEMYKTNCQNCNKCFINFQKHICLKDQVCPICQDGFENSQDGMIILPCGHYIHRTCRLQLLESQDVKCPICRKLILTGEAKQAYELVCEQKYLEEILPPVWENKFIWATCNECHQRFLAQQHPVGYRCANIECLSWNTTYQEASTSSVSDCRVMMQIQNTLLEESGITLIKPVVNDFQFYERFFCAKFEKEINQQKKLFEESFDCFLRLLGIQNQSREYQLVILNKMFRAFYEGIDLASLQAVLQ